MWARHVGARRVRVRTGVHTHKGSLSGEITRSQNDGVVTGGCGLVCSQVWRHETQDGRAEGTADTSSSKNSNEHVGFRAGSAEETSTTR